MRKVRINWSAAYYPHRRGPEEGRFHGWGMEQSPDPESHGEVTCAIIELDNGKIELVEPTMVHFLDRPADCYDEHHPEAPKIIQDYRSAGWVFEYDPETISVDCIHDEGGKQSICEIRTGFAPYEMGKAIAELLNGKPDA